MTQEEFDAQFITVKEISSIVGNTTAAVWYAKKRGMLPNALEVKGSKLCVWNRAEVMPIIQSWKDVRHPSI